MQSIRSCRQHLLTSLALLPLFFSSPGIQAAEPLVLAVQPILDEEQTRVAFQPLCDHLSRIAGRECRIHTSPNFYAYWDLVRRGGEYNLVLDAAHFTDYRANNQGFEVLAKIPDSVSYSLVTNSGNFILDASELTGKRVATLGIPSIGAARLNALFPNPSRQPVIIEIANAEAGINQLRERRITAAILPTPVVAQHMARGEELLVILTTDQIPHIALSAAPTLPAELRQKLRQSLTRAHDSKEGQAMLKAIGFERFDPATATVYQGQARILKEYWGYKQLVESSRR
jgi:hypothetical protein